MDPLLGERRQELLQGDRRVSRLDLPGLLDPEYAMQARMRHLALEGARVTLLCVSTAGYSRFPRPKLPPELHGREIERELAELGVEVARVEPHPLHWTLDGRPVRRAVDALKQLREQHRFMKGLFSWIGFPQKAVLYRREPRFDGKTPADPRSIPESGAHTEEVLREAGLSDGEIATLISA